MARTTHYQSTFIELLYGVISALPSGVIAISNKGYVNLINSQALLLLGLESNIPNDYLDTHYSQFFEQTSDVIDKIESSLISGQQREIDIKNITINRKNVDIHCCSMLKGIVILIEETNAEAVLAYRKNIDMLTQLNNRYAFEKQFHSIIDLSSEATKQAALAFFDIDNFKAINDSYGYTLGDQVICRVANILKGRTKRNQAIARMSGDQFVILLHESNTHEALAFANAVGRLIDSHPFFIGDTAVRVTVSCGIAPFCSDTAPELNKLLSIANTACKVAKEQGKNRTYIIDTNNTKFENYIEEVKRVEEINRAILNEDLVLYCQRISAICDPSAPPYYEVLIRLRESDGQIISPYLFIPTAERYHMMPEIDRYVMAFLFKSMSSQGDTVYSVNLSGQTISDYTLIDFVKKMLVRYVFNPENIIFEITETAAMSDFHGTIEVMNELRGFGFKFSLDDFGTGLSSFTYLKQLPLDTVKIDGSFVRDIVNDDISYQMVKSTHDIGKAMGLKTVAEFVEDVQIYQSLREIGVQYAQGYYIHKPEPLANILRATNSYTK